MQLSVLVDNNSLIDRYFLAGLNLKALHCCHCTDLAAKMVPGRSLPVEEVGVGLKLDCA